MRLPALGIHCIHLLHCNEATRARSSCGSRTGNLGTEWLVKLRRLIPKHQTSG